MVDERSRHMGTLSESTGRPLAVVTGASSGIGYELARPFGERGFDLLIAAEDAGIDRAAHQLRLGLGIAADAVQADLATYQGVEQFCRSIQATGRPIDALALNAGVGVGGEFARRTEL